MCNELWLFLCEQGEDMRQWDGEPTSKLEVCVCEQGGKSCSERVTQEGCQCSCHRETGR